METFIDMLDDEIMDRVFLGEWIVCGTFGLVIGD